jgi:hypothetical protein
VRERERYIERGREGEGRARVFVKKKMTQVILHIYDVTNSGSDKTNNTILHINKIFKDGIGLGGIFHSAVQVSLPFPLSIYICMSEFVYSLVIVLYDAVMDLGGLRFGS